MKSKISVLLVLILTLATLTGCSSALVPKAGMTAFHKDLIPLVGDKQKGTKENQDLVLEYELSSVGDDFLIKGNADFLPSVVNTFPKIRNFILYLVFLGEDDSVLDVCALVPLYQELQRIEAPISFSGAGKIPVGAKSFVFSYNAVFIGDSRDFAEEKYVDFFPFSREKI